MPILKSLRLHLVAFYPPSYGLQLLLTMGPQKPPLRPTYHKECQIQYQGD